MREGVPVYTSIRGIFYFIGTNFRGEKVSRFPETKSPRNLLASKFAKVYFNTRNARKIKLEKVKILRFFFPRETFSPRKFVLIKYHLFKKAPEM